jgi:hypothetical protein
MKFSKTTFALALFVTLSPLSSQASERKISCDTLPTSIKEKSREIQKGAVLKSCIEDTSGKKTEYELEMLKNGRGYDVTLNERGDVIEVEDEVDQSALPPAVASYLDKAAAGGKIASVESLSRQGRIVQYEAVVIRNGKRSEIACNPDGTRATAD